MNNAIQTIFQKYGVAYLQNYKPSYEQKQVYNSIIECKTPKMGGHVYKCEECGKIIYAYKSCNNRHCPNCQDFKKEQWRQKHQEDVINVPYFHVVMTVPSELHKIFYHNKRKCYNIILKSATETILELMEDKKYLGGKPGIVAMLHTWSQTMNYHPHVHLIVTGGGVTPTGEWKNAKEGYLLPVKVISAKFKGKLLSKLKKEKLEFYNEIKELENEEKFIKYISELYEKKWVCYAKESFKGVETVFNYLSRYVYRVCISNERIKQIGEEKVTFEYKDTENRSIKKKMTIKGSEFIRKFLLHTLPKGFMKIRYCGIYAGKNKKERIEKIKILTKTKKTKYKYLSKIELLNKITGRDVTKCKECEGNLIIIKTMQRKKPPDVETKRSKRSYA